MAINGILRIIDMWSRNFKKQDFRQIDDYFEFNHALIHLIAEIPRKYN
jgi:hypothetical protein